MSDYEQLLENAHQNLTDLQSKLGDLDKLHQDIQELLKQPEILDKKLANYVELSEEIGNSTKKYLDGNNSLFTTKLNELSAKINEFEREVTRLKNTDLEKLFEDLQKIFIDQTRQDLAREFKRFEEKSKDLQSKIDELKKQIERLERIDLEKDFDKLQKNLSDILGAINTISLTINTITQHLNTIVQTLGTIQVAIDTNHKEARQLVNTFSDTTSKHLTEQDATAKRNFELLEVKINSVVEQNEVLKKEIKTTRLIQLFGFGLMLVVLIYLVIK